MVATGARAANPPNLRFPSPPAGTLGVDPRPKHLGYGIHVGKLLAEQSGPDAVPHDVLQERVGIFLRIPCRGFDLGRMRWMRSHELEAIVIGTAQTELNLAERGFSQTLQGIMNLGDFEEFPGQRTEIRTEHFIHEFVLIFAVEVDRGGRVFDGSGDPSHGHSLVAFRCEQFARRVQNLLAQLLLFSFPSLDYAPQSNLT